MQNVCAYISMDRYIHIGKICILYAQHAYARTDISCDSHHMCTYRDLHASLCSYVCTYMYTDIYKHIYIYTPIFACKFTFR